MIRRFLKDTRGNFAIMTSIAMVPILGAVAIAVDYSEMSRQRQETLNALDAAGIATAQEILSSKSDADLHAYAQKYFEANLRSVNPANATLRVVLPAGTAGGGDLEMSADLKYQPYFFSGFVKLMGGTNAEGSETLALNATAKFRLKNTIEVALVLDNSGSMSTKGKGTGKPRMDLLKDAAKHLVETLSKQGEAMKQIPEPVRFAVVPFAASVNVGPTPANKTETRDWLDTRGISPIHHENFDWTSMKKSGDTAAKYVEQIAGVWYRRGDGWGEKEDQILTRFTLYEELKQKQKDGTVKPYATWNGCVEARPSPLNNNDATPSRSDGKTLFVPMFAPDEADEVWVDSNGNGKKDRNDLTYTYKNSWWPDAVDQNDAKLRQSDMKKYFTAKPYGWVSDADGPNFSCTTRPITPLRDVTALDGTGISLGKTLILNAIDEMRPSGNTNVPEGAAWGWRVLSSREPFTEGRPEEQGGNDKIMIVLTDGANTYGDLSDNRDAALNRSTYAAHGYAGQEYPGAGTTRLYKDTNVNKNTFTSTNYQKALDKHLETVCENAKDDGIMVITVSLDLDPVNQDADKKAIEALTKCASPSRFSKGEDGKSRQLYFEATGADLKKTFEDIANELSNLRIVR